MPPIASEEVVGFRIAPSVEKSGGADQVPVPVLLMLCQTAFNDGESRRQLKILRCPAVPLQSWALEVGMQPEPRIAAEVLPGTAGISVSVFPRSRCGVFQNHNLTV